MLQKVCRKKTHQLHVENTCKIHVIFCHMCVLCGFVFCFFFMCKTPAVWSEILLCTPLPKGMFTRLISCSYWTRFTTASNYGPIMSRKTLTLTVIRKSCVCTFLVRIAQTHRVNQKEGQVLLHMPKRAKQYRNLYLMHTLRVKKQDAFFAFFFSFFTCRKHQQYDLTFSG